MLPYHHKALHKETVVLFLKEYQRLTSMKIIHFLQLRRKKYMNELLLSYAIRQITIEKSLIIETIINVISYIIITIKNILITNFIKTIRKLIIKIIQPIISS